MPFIRVLFRRCFIRIFTTDPSLTGSLLRQSGKPMSQQSTSRDSDVPPSCVVGISLSRLSGTGRCHLSGTSSSVDCQVECNTHTWQHGNEIGVIIKQCSDQPIYSCDQWENTCNKTDILSSDDYFIAFFDFHDTKLTIRYGISLRLCDRVFSPCRSRGSCYCLINNDFQLACQWGTCGAGDILMPFDWKISRPPVGRLVFFRQRRTSPQFTTRLIGVKQAKTDGDIQIKKSRNDENKQPHKRSKRSSKPLVQPNKKGCKGGGNHRWSNNRNSGVGDSQTCNPRCGLGNIPHNRNTDNLLVTHFIKLNWYGYYEIKQRCNRSYAADAPRMLYRRTHIRYQDGEPIQEYGRRSKSLWVEAYYEKSISKPPDIQASIIATYQMDFS